MNKRRKPGLSLGSTRLSHSKPHIPGMFLPSSGYVNDAFGLAWNLISKRVPDQLHVSSLPETVSSVEFVVKFVSLCRRIMTC
jgi:hypothetical protein